METSKKSILGVSTADNIQTLEGPGDRKASAADNPEKVQCFIQLTESSKPFWCTGSSFEELKKQAERNVVTGYRKRSWDNAHLVCYENGCRILNMDALRSYIAKGYKLFFFVGPNAPTFEEIALDIEWVAELYQELTSGATDMSFNVKLWPHSRRQELEAIYCARSHLLAEKLNMDEHDLIVSQREVHTYGELYDPLWKEPSAESDTDMASDRDSDSFSDGVDIVILYRTSHTSCLQPAVGKHLIAGPRRSQN